MSNLNNLKKLVRQGRMIPLHAKGADDALYVIGFKRKASSKKSHHYPDWLVTPLKVEGEIETLKGVVILESSQVVPRIWESFIAQTKPVAISDQAARANAELERAANLNEL